MNCFIVQKHDGNRDWFHISTYDNEAQADACYYKCAGNDKVGRYRILEHKIIKETMENRNETR